MAARVLWRLLPSLAVLLAVLHGRALLVVLRLLLVAALRLFHVAVVASGALMVWALLRWYQLGFEREIYDRARANQRFYDKYRARTNADGFQLKVVKRLPVATHLRTAWALAPEIADEIAAFVKLAVRDYVAYWFAPISPNDDFPVDVQFLLADLLGALVARVLEIDSAQALTMAAKSVELLRLHLGWFREAYAQLAEEHPLAFQGDDPALLVRRQELVAGYVQKAKFLHPGCVITSQPAKKASGAAPSAADPADVLYLRHVATQLLVQLKPELGQSQSSTNLFVSLAMNFMRECLVFKALKPVFEYSQPRYANEAVVAALLAESDDNAGASSPVTSPTASSTTATHSSGGTTGLGFNVPLPQLNSPAIDLKSLRMTKSFFYKASKRSTEQAEAALHAVFDAMSSAASTASSGMSSFGSMGSSSSPTAGDMGGFDNDYWSESTAFGIVSPRSPTSEPLSPQMQQVPVATPSSERKGGAFASIFSKEDRISFPKTPRMMLSRAPTSSGSTSSSKSVVSAAGLVPDTPGGSSTHMEDLKNMKANLESSLNSSLFKVKKTFRNIGGHIQDQSQMAVTTTTTQAANLIKRPGKLFQKALRRGDTSTETPLPMSPIDFPSTPPPLGSSQSLDGGDTTDDGESEKTMLRSPTETTSPATPNTPNSKAVHMQDRVLLLLEKTTANYIKLHQERAEMRSSARSRELYELLSALEDVFMLGYRKPGDGITYSPSNGADTPPGSPNSRRSTVPLTAREASKVISDDSSGSSPGNPVVLLDPQQVYWNYLAQDRPDTPFLNEHWHFVQSACPKCADSESFYSTRGVQWILVALEKGMLWDYVTALNLNRRLTELFYEDISVLRNGKLMEKVLKTLFQLNKLQVTLEIPQVLGRKSVFEKELGIAHPTAAQAQVVRVIETAWEVERYVPIHGWVKSQDKRTKELPSSEWIWESEWTLETPGARELPDVRLSNGPRRSGSAGSDSSDIEASGMWEYAKTLDNHFHDKEKKLDAVRRRKWTRRRRQLPPVLSLPSPTGKSELSASRSSNGFDASTRPPQLDAQVSPRRHATRQGSWDADDIELATRKKNPALLTKRRSFSLDKGSGSPAPVSPATPPAHRLSGVGAAFRRRKLRATSGFASLRRSRGAPSPNDSKTEAVKPSATLSDDELAGADEEDDDAEEDDGNLCFRCYRALGSRADGPSSPSADSCQSCHQRVCASCHNYYAFLVYPPPLESSKKEQVCGSCYDRLVMRYKLKVDAHVGKYFIKESERDGGEDDPFSEGSNGPLSPGQASASSAGDLDSPTQRSRYRFEVTVQVRDESSYAWSVIKSFYDFEQLEKQLFEKLKKQEKKHGIGSACCQRHWRGVDYTELRNVEPSLKQFSATASSAPYEKKLFVLETFLQRLLQCDTLCQSSVVQKFLLLGDNISVSSSPSVSFPSDSNDAVTATTGSGVLSPTGGSSGIGAASGMVMVENGKWRRGKWIAPEINSKETKMRVLQQLEVSLFAILNEVFEFDGIGLLRRHLFSMTRSFIKAFLSASHFRKIERQYLTFTDPKKMASHLAAFREYMFPETPVEPPPAQLSAAEMQALRKKSLEAILSSLPSTIVSVVGDVSSANAALKLHEFLQHEVFLKNLLFSMCDELMPHVFPDTVPYTPKAKPSKPAI